MDVVDLDAVGVAVVDLDAVGFDVAGAGGRACAVERAAGSTAAATGTALVVPGLGSTSAGTTGAAAADGSADELPAGTSSRKPLPSAEASTSTPTTAADTPSRRRDRRRAVAGRAGTPWGAGADGPGTPWVDPGGRLRCRGTAWEPAVAGRPGHGDAPDRAGIMIGAVGGSVT